MLLSVKVTEICVIVSLAETLCGLKYNWFLLLVKRSSVPQTF